MQQTSEFVNDRIIRCSYRGRLRGRSRDFNPDQPFKHRSHKASSFNRIRTQLSLVAYFVVTMTTPFTANTPGTPSTSYSIRSSIVRSSKPSIYDRNLNRSRGLELSHAAYTLLFAEMVSYAQNKVEGITGLERRYFLCFCWFLPWL